MYYSNEDLLFRFKQSRLQFCNENIISIN